MNPRVVVAAACALLSSACLIDRAAIGGDPDAGVADPPDARLVVDVYVAPGEDAALDAPVVVEPDAFVPGADAWAPDAFVPLVPDAFVPTPDAFVDPPDAFVPPDAFITPICVPETCNARDDDCDGTVDNGACSVMLTGGGSSVCTAFTRAGRSYLFCRPEGTWNVARSWCRSFAGGAYDLTAFANGAEQDAVRGAIDVRVWIGMSDDPMRIPAASDEDFRWVDGSSPSFDAWLDGEPSTSRTAGCVLLRTDGEWDAGSCNDDSNTEAWVCEAAVLP